MIIRCEKCGKILFELTKTNKNDTNEYIYSEVVILCKNKANGKYCKHINTISI